LTTYMRATQAVIYLDNLTHNINNIKKRIPPGTRICLAVKADAYGHGAIEISKTAINAGVQCLGVATVQEAIELREAGIVCPVILFSLPLPGEISALFYYHIIPVVASKDLVLLCEQEGKQNDSILDVHLKIDTGMGRIGCHPDKAVFIAQTIKECSFVNLGGICTHFPGSDLVDNSFARTQVQVFNDVIRQIKEKGIDPGIIHAANSGAIINMPEALYNMVRPGILLYGYYPSKEQKRSIDVKPVMELKTKISFIKTVPPDTPVSYGMTYRTKETTRIATIPAGYGDGYSRLLSNRGEVLIKGKRYPVVGRVCMDQSMIDIGPSSDIGLYNDVTLFGPTPPAPTAEEIADIMGTIPYEVTCLIAKRVPRVYIVK
jgi:alanine racemase